MNIVLLNGNLLGHHKEVHTHGTNASHPMIFRSQIKIIGLYAQTQRVHVHIIHSMEIAPPIHAKEMMKLQRDAHFSNEIKIQQQHTVKFDW